MRLKRILKENHERDINEIAFCFNKTTTSIIKPLDTTEEDDEEENFEEEEEEEFDIFDKLNIDQVDASNILGTLGGAQINVYDNEHFGNHLDIMSNFNLGDGLDEEEDYKEKILNSFCWIHRKDDAIIATGGADGDVHVLSIALSNEIAVLKGHTKPIVDVKAYPQDNQHIISVSKDGTMRLWNVEKQTCVAIFEYECNVVCFHPSGETFITGTTKGELREWKIPALIGSMDEDDDEPVVVGKKSSRILKKMHGDCTIGKIHFI
ncbi:WD40-repeat-containing domain protein [Chlamydoabsidia padenii]|nr:WD40-repeat-containing domain protein [Chlamydoabsidia padenii]